MRTIVVPPSGPVRYVTDQAISALTPEQMAAMYPEPAWLQTGTSWPPQDIRDHIDECEKNHKLFRCRLSEVFPEHYQRLHEIDPMRAPTTYEQEVNLFHSLTMLWRALLTAEPPQFTAGDPGSPEAKAVERIAKQTGLVAQIKKAVIDQSAKADAVLVVGADPRVKQVTISIQPPERWYPFVDPGDAGRKLADVLFYEERVPEGRVEVRYLNAAIHYPGLVKHRRFRIHEGKLVRVDAIRRPADPSTLQSVPEDQETGIPVTLVYTATNICTSSDVTGMSDYDAVETIVPELSVRASQWAKLFDKFTDPTAYGPRLQAETNPVTGEAELRFRGRYINVEEGDQTPGYAVWDPQLAAAFEAWDRMMNVYHMATGSNPAAFEVGDGGGGEASSGTALRLKMARPMQVAADKAQELDPAVTGALYAAQLLEVALNLVPEGETYQPTQPRTDWRDGLPDDPVERATIESTRTGNKATSSVLSAIKRLDNVSDEEAEQELIRIQEEQAMFSPVIAPATDLNGPNGQEVLAEARRLMKADPELSEDQALKQAETNLKAGG